MAHEQMAFNHFISKSNVLQEMMSHKSAQKGAVPMANQKEELGTGSNEKLGASPIFACKTHLLLIPLKINTLGKTLLL